jgi:hypothetical protein
VDGCCDHTNTIADEEILEHYTLLLRDADLLVYGRKTYQLMVPYWPDVAKNRSETKASHEFAKTFVSKNKIVFSQSLESAEQKPFFWHEGYDGHAEFRPRLMVTGRRLDATAPPLVFDGARTRLHRESDGMSGGQSATPCDSCP